MSYQLQTSSPFLKSVVAACVVAAAANIASAEYLNGIKWEAPPIVTPGAANSDAPSDATVLFDGTDFSQWKNADQWSVEDGVAIVGKGAIKTAAEFGDCQLHIEWSAPTPPKGSGQGRGNSGVFMMGIYEIQVLDSFENETYHDGQAGSIYKQTPPAANATRPPGQWNTYDIYWTCPRFAEDGTLQSPAYVTVVHNGVLIQNHFALKGDTPYHRPPQYKPHAATGPISLQDHGNPMRFRNIWVREFKPVVGVPERKPFLRVKGVETPIED